MIHYTVDEGLPDKYIRCAIVDHLGQLWIGTEDGLSCFDGHHFKNYFHDELDSFSLPQSSINYLAEDRQGRIWIATKNAGLCYFNPITQKFIKAPLPVKDSTVALPEYILSIEVGKKDILWLNTYRQGLYAYQPDSGTLKHFNLPDRNAQDIWNTNTAHAVVEDPADKQILWITGRNGLYKLNKTTGKISHIINTRAGQTKHLVTLGNMQFTTQHDMWIESWGDGIVHYNTKTKMSHSYHYGGDNIVVELAPYNDSMLWVGPADSSLGFFNVHTKKFEFISVAKNDPYAVPQRNINKIIPLGDGRFWITTYDNGIYYYNPANQDFMYKSIEENPSKKPEIWINGFSWNSKNHVIYFATSNTRYLIGEDSKNHLVRIPFENAPEKKVDIFGMTTDNEGDVWLVGRKIYYYHPGDPACKVFHNNLTDSLEKTHPHYYFMAIKSDNEGRLWLADGDGRIIRIDKNRNRSSVFFPSKVYAKAPTEQINFNDFYQDKKERLWLVSEYGLSCFNPKNSQFTFYDDRQWGEGINPLSLTEGPKGNFWMGSAFLGLFKLTPEGDSLVLKQHWGRKNGLPSSYITQQTWDGAGNLWLGTANGIVQLNPKTNAMRIYGSREGVRNTYIIRPLSFLPNKHLYVAQPNGFIWMNLKGKNSTLKPPNVVLRGIEILGQNLTLDTALNYKRKITLSYQQNFFTIKFSGVTFSEPQEIKYAYTLAGYNGQWVVQGASDNTAEFTGVKPGRYIFMVKASDNGGHWSQPRQIIIEIVPPFWQTWWFYALLLLLIIGLVFLLLYFRIKRVRRQEQIKSKFDQQLSEMEMKALRSQMNPHFIFNCLNSIKHLIATGDEENAMLYLTRFAQMIRLVLNHSSKTEISLGDEMKMVELYIQMEQLRFVNRFHYKIEVSPDIDLAEIDVPPMIIQPFVENAIWHGLLHKKGEAHLSVSLQKKDRYLFCLIEDNGIGREKAKSLKSKSVEKNKSMGISLVNRRLRILRAIKHLNINLEIVDKANHDGKSLGTIVILKIPL